MPGTTKLFVGNKVDLREPGNPSHVTRDKAAKVIEALGVKYYECSALTREGIEEVFLAALKEVLGKKNFKAKGSGKEDSCCSCF